VSWPITIDDDSPLIAAATLLRDPDADLAVVRDTGCVLAGVITKTDIVRQISHCRGASCMAAASAVMTQAVIYCRLDNLLHEIWLVMKERHLKNIPILGRTPVR
jgi:CBS domain-containing protein